jgi:hypothetical protein
MHNKSNVASATTNNVPPYAPSNLLASAAAPTQINLTWSDNASNETGYKVEAVTVFNFMKMWGTKK